MNSYRQPNTYKLEILFTIESDNKTIKEILNYIEEQTIKDYVVFDTITENKVEAHIITLYCDDHIKWTNYGHLNKLVCFYDEIFSYQTL